MAAKKKGINPVALGIGVALGAAGALFLSKKENRTKVAKAVKKLKQKSEGGIFSAVSTALSDLNSLTEQRNLDSESKKSRKKSR